MLQRAASNAYSWWWASHIRTKQSKWLEQNLQDMGEKVQIVLKLIEEDGDSFAKRAEMYYKKRPELISFVEESYRAYRALAERYDHISTELQNANNTIASVFPEQVQFSIDEEDEEALQPRFPKKPPDVSKPNIPKVPDAPITDLKSVIISATKTLGPKKKTHASTSSSVAVVKSGLNKTEAVEEIDKLQKRILGLQTEKEFVQSSYENGLAKYWEIEKQIKEMQERVFVLQDEIGGEGVAIDDDEARNLMTAAALKSCEETLAQLQEKQETAAEEARIESKRMKDAHGKLLTLKIEYHCDQANAKDEKVEPKDVAEEETGEPESLHEKIKEHFESSRPLTVTEMAEKVDAIVNKVIGLETAVSSQTALVKRLRIENDELQAQIRTLEDDKASLIDGRNDLSNKLKEMVEKLNEVQALDRIVEKQNNNFQMQFNETRFNLDRLSEELPRMKPDEELELRRSSSNSIEEQYQTPAESQKDFKVPEDGPNPDNGFEDPETAKQDEKPRLTESLQKEEEDESPAGLGLPRETKEQQQSMDIDNIFEKADDSEKPGADGQSESHISPESSLEEGRDPNRAAKGEKQSSFQTIGDLLNIEPSEHRREEEDEPDWRTLFLNGMENKEKILLTEYTSMLRNYKDVKKKLSELDDKNDSLFDASNQIKELKNANAMKDEEIRSLRQKLGLMQKCFVEDRDSEDDVNTILNDQPATSATEEKLRMAIDELLEENLDFWLKFSTSFHEIHKYETGIQDLRAEITKLEEKGKKLEGSSTAKYFLKSDARPLYKHLREIQTALTVWLEKSALLKEELQSRFSSLCNIQEEITAALKSSAEDEDFKFTSYQAAKFQGEVLNMKQENNKVADELQTGIDRVTALQLEIEKTLLKLNDEFRLSGSKKQQSPQLRHTESQTRVPLRSFIFGVKPKKPKPSIFSCMTPALHSKYHVLREEGPP